MEKNLVRVLFETGLAKKITNGEVDGRIVTRDGRSVRIVCWDRNNDTYPIVALIPDEDEIEDALFFTKEGTYYTEGETYDDLMLEIPEYMTFKDGDVVTFDNLNVLILFAGGLENKDGSIISKYYAFIDGDGFKIVPKGCEIELINPRLATEEEKQKFINALKVSDNPKAKEYLKRFFGVEEKKEYEFTFKQDVLVRQNNKDLWCGAQFSHKELNHYVVFGGSYFLQCIPYNEKTAHLLGTTDNYE